jgi:hypothetical protein
MPSARDTGWCVAVLLGLGLASAAPAQERKNATLRSAITAYEALEFSRAITLASRALGQRLNGADQARAYELLGFAYAATDSSVKAVDAFKQLILLEPDREVDPTRISPKVTSAFQLALSQVLVVRALTVDSAAFVAGQGGVPIRYTVTSPAHVRVRAIGGGRTIEIDSSVATGPVALQWSAAVPGGTPIPVGDYTVVVEATAGQNSFAASRAVRVAHGAVDTVPHLAALPGYEFLPETEVPPKSWRPMGLAFLYAGIAAAGTLALESGSLGAGSRRELAAVSAIALAAGLVSTLRKPPPQPARANILYNRLLRDQIAQRNAEIARVNAERRRQVELRVVPIPRGAARP